LKCGGLNNLVLRQRPVFLNLDFAFRRRWRRSRRPPRPLLPPRRRNSILWRKQKIEIKVEISNRVQKNLFHFICLILLYWVFLYKQCYIWIVKLKWTIVTNSKRGVIVIQSFGFIFISFWKSKILTVSRCWKSDSSDAIKFDEWEGNLKGICRLVTINVSNLKINTDIRLFIMDHLKKDPLVINIQ